MKTKAFSYLRVSGRGQIDGDGFPRQRASIAEYAKRNQITIEREFIEKGVSGTLDSFDREELTNLFVALKSNGVRLVLVEMASRLARDLMISEVLLAEFRKLGVRVISAECGTDLTVEDKDPTKILIRQLLGAVSQWQKSVDVQKLRAARIRTKQAKGRCEGQKPYGYYEGEQAILDTMIKYRMEGMTIAEVAARLNADGVKPRNKEASWRETTIQRILARV